MMLFSLLLTLVPYVLVFLEFSSTSEAFSVGCNTVHGSRNVQLGRPGAIPALYYTDDDTDTPLSKAAEAQRKDWIDRSVEYYSKVMREERRRQAGQKKEYEHSEEYQDYFLLLAKKHYFALRKIKDGKPQHAELIYRRIIQQLATEDDEHCQHAQLAVTTLLLALLLQRTGDVKATRSVFLNFFRMVVMDHADGEEAEECACSAKVLQAFALFEMKQGNAIKSLEIVSKAVQLDPSLEPVLSWKQFRDAMKRRQRAKQSTQQAL